MPTCVRNGCKKEYTEEENTDDVCKHHPGSPVFHEGLKSWSCCKDVNKPELDFDEFMKIQVSYQTTSQGDVARPQADADAKPVTKEVFGAESTTASTFKVSATPKPSTPAPVIEEEDDLAAPVPSGATCRRNGCKAIFISDVESRTGDGEASVCTYHPAAPIFHEGSKGYLCCKRRVLEFDEFMKIEGCKKGKHVFVPKKQNTQEEVITTCRIDHYQTPSTVCVSVFAKKADKERSKVSFEESQVHLDLYLPDSKRFQRSLNLYGPILPDESNFSILGTKVELNLKKKDGKSWNLLEATDKEIGFNLIFGVSGRTGTIGAKEAIVDSTNRLNG
ncbi:chord-domain-containing protein [Schizopora paradoxa]|uniref:Chord-domain-containing protein n=1 Tax=Schizopora paradoxa TaxID=27342 RepID=A0A0H2RRD5_9AGAM|nr:chord-domain-containing protein [Schizopora paradoxa]